MTAEREQAYEVAEVAYDNANRSDIYANPGPLRAAIDAAWDLAVAEGRREAAQAIRAKATGLSSIAAAPVRLVLRGDDERSFMVGMEFAARIAEGGAP